MKCKSTASYAVKLAEEALKFNHSPSKKQKAIVGDARELPFLKDDSFDLIITHPPYMNIIKYSDGRIPADLSNISSLPKFCDEIGKVAKELFRVLKPDKYCAGRFEILWPVCAIKLSAGVSWSLSAVVQ